MSEDSHALIRDTVNQFSGAVDTYAIANRGRPEKSAREHAERKLRHQHFGKILKAMRESAGLTPSQVARSAGLQSGRKLTQYETVCFPPGEMIVLLASVYQVDPGDLARLVLSHSHPEIFELITGQKGYKPPEMEILQLLGRSGENSKGEGN